MPKPERIRVLTLIESNTVTGPSRILLDFASQAEKAEPGLPAVDVTVMTFRRGDSESALAQAAEKVGVPVILIPEKRRWDPGVIPDLRHLITDFNPDVLESRNVKSHFLIRATGLHKRFPWIAWNHGYTSKDRLDRAYNQLDRWSLRGAFRVMTVCKPFAAAIEANGVSKDKISILHNFVRSYSPPAAEEKAALKQQLGVQNERIILTVGRMSAEKGHADLLHAVALLREKDLPGFRVVLVGDGPEQENLQQLASRLGITPLIVRTGFQRNVAPYYGIADIFVLPSHSEGSPNVVLEAMAAGLPIVATSVGGVPEIIENGRTGILVSSRNPAALAEALKTVLSSDEAHDRLGTAAKQEVGASFTFENYKRALTEFYLKIF
jgi:glycosyltransferase involved in cell wall biosynthesis